MLAVIQSFGEELPQACQNTCVEVWPVVESVMQNFGGLHYISERSCGTLRLGLQFFGDAALPVIPSVLGRLSGAFESSSHASYIWILGKIVTRFGNEGTPILRNSLRQSFEGVNAHLFGILKMQSADTIPDGKGSLSIVAILRLIFLLMVIVMEDYLHYLLRMLEFCPDLLFLSPSFPNTFRVVLSGLMLYQPDIIYPSLEFILNMLRHDCLTILNAAPGPSPPPNFPLYAAAIRGIIEEQGFSLVGFLLAGMLSHFPEDSISTVVTIFKILAQVWPQQMVAWLPGASEHIPNASLPIESRRVFISDFTRCVIVLLEIRFTNTVAWVYIFYSSVASRQFDKVKQVILNLHRASRRVRDRTRLTALDT